MNRRLGVVMALLTLSGCRPTAPLDLWHDPSPHRVRMIAIAPGVTLEVLDWGGEGPPLVFLSGLQDVAHGFDDFAPRFVDHFHVLAITRRGYGASSRTPAGYDVATRLADLRAVLDSLALPRVSLVGHSMAGDELTAFAASYPDRVTRLIYLDAIYDHSTLGPVFAAALPPPPLTPADSASPAALQAYDLRNFGQHIPEAQIRAIERFDAHGHLVGGVTPSSIDSQMIAGAGHPDYGAVRAPALVICALIDSMPQLFPAWRTFDPAMQARAERFTTLIQRWGVDGRDSIRPRLAHAEWLMLPGANHYLFDSNEPEVEGAMRRFLALP